MPSPDVFGSLNPTLNFAQLEVRIGLSRIQNVLRWACIGLPLVGIGLLPIHIFQVAALMAAAICAGWAMLRGKDPRAEKIAIQADKTVAVLWHGAQAMQQVTLSSPIFVSPFLIMLRVRGDAGVRTIRITPDQMTSAQFRVLCVQLRYLTGLS